jgi:hypothetical protein
MTSAFWNYFILIASALLAVVLLVLMYFAWRGKVISTHPHCRKCKFNLHGLPDTSHRCPECGTDITIAKNRLPVLRERRTRVIGACLFVLLLICVITAINHRNLFIVRSLITALPDRVLVAFWDGSKVTGIYVELILRFRNDPADTGLIDALIRRSSDSDQHYNQASLTLRQYAKLTALQEQKLFGHFLGHIKTQFTYRPTHDPRRPYYFQVGADNVVPITDAHARLRLRAFLNDKPIPAPIEYYRTETGPDVDIVCRFGPQNQWKFLVPSMPDAKPGDTYKLDLELAVSAHEDFTPGPLTRTFTHSITHPLTPAPVIALHEHQTDAPPPFTAAFEPTSDGTRLFIDLKPTGPMPLLVSGTLIINGQRLASYASVALRHNGPTRIAFDVPTIPPTVDLEVFSIPEDFESDARFTSTWHGYVTLPSLPIPASAQRTRISPDPFPQQSPERISSRELWDLLNTLRAGQEPPNLQATIQLLLDAQGDPSHPWDRQIASALELLYLQNKLNPEQWHRYLRQAIDTVRLSHFINPEFVGLVGPRLAESGIVDLSDLKLEIFNTTGQLLATDPQPLSSRLIMTGRSINVSGHSPPFTLHLTGSIRASDTNLPINKTWPIPTPK